MQHNSKLALLTSSAATVTMFSAAKMKGSSKTLGLVQKRKKNHSWYQQDHVLLSEGYKVKDLVCVFNDFIVTCMGNKPALTKLISARRWSSLNNRVYVISKDTWPN